MLSMKSPAEVLNQKRLNIDHYENKAAWIPLVYIDFHQQV